MKKITLFDDLEIYLQDLDEILPEEEEFLQNKEKIYSVSMLMMNIINSCIDIGSEIVNIKRLGLPTSYKHVFEILMKEKIISLQLSKKMKGLVGLRNLLAHEYGEINVEILYEQASDLSFINEFIKKSISFF
ncbi:MAG: DUF86 domain-containing protein [Candidatus Woesearchaeota archaeon]